VPRPARRACGFVVEADTDAVRQEHHVEFGLFGGADDVEEEVKSELPSAETSGCLHDPT
jgi:hypothetical protein